jgi:hypothetical protein
VLIANKKQKTKKTHLICSIKHAIAARKQPSSSDHDHAQQSGDTSAEMNEVA